MAKLESSLKNMILSLTSICLVAAGLLAGIYMLTAEPIAKAAEQKKENAQKAVLAGQEGVAVEAEADGFGGKIKVMVGFAADGTILGYEVLDQQETPGLGTHCVEWFKNAEKPGQNIVGRKATGAFSVSKDGGDVDAITAATISSRAFLAAVNNAYAKAFDVEAASGATKKCCEQEGACCEGEKVCCEDEKVCCGACEHKCEKACENECNNNKED